MQDITHAQLVDFVYRDAFLLDSQRLDEWCDLFADDGIYWVPMSATQTDRAQHQSITVEDKLVLQIRAARLKNPKNYPQQSGIASQHVLQAPQIEEADAAANRYRLRTAFFYAEVRGETQLILTGTLRHTLRSGPRGLEIVERRVDLLNAATPLPLIFMIP